MIKKTKGFASSMGVYELMHDNGRKEKRVMTKQQFAGLKRSKAWKRVLSCECMCKVEIHLKLKF